MKKAPFSGRCVLYRVAFFPVISLLLLLCLAGCPDDTEEDISIGEITIYNIPAQIPVFGNATVTAPVFKVYLNASNTQSENDPPAAKGVKKITQAMEQADGTYTVTIPLQKPNPPDKEDPNEDTGPWSGTANYFSVTISPADVKEHGVNAIWVRAGTTLNKGKKSCDWNSLMNFRALIESDPNDVMEFAKKADALYRDIVCKDPEIEKN
jgi:hypothetical protein